MQQEVEYKGFTIQARPQELRDGGWNTVVYLRRLDTIKPFYASNVWKSEKEAVAGCLEYGRRIIDGGVPEFSGADLP